jgi:nicotinate-nucleotide adenylyltransferase
LLVVISHPSSATSDMRIGIFGGTFDPPHLGHLRLADAARAQLRLGKVLWVVTADPPHKQGQPISPVDDRLAMVQAAIVGEPAYAVSRVDVDRPGPHWAADTVALLAQQFRGNELIYLMGGDSLRDLPTWGRPAEFLAHCSLGVMRRPGDAIDLGMLAMLERRLPGLTAKVQFVEVEPVEVASHEIRRRVQSGESIREWVPEAVVRIIAERGLYR